MYKRPTIVRRVPTAFVTQQLPGGGRASCWIPENTVSITPSGHPSLVGAILDKMSLGDSHLSPRVAVWTPPVDYKFIASRMACPESYIKRCEDWLAAHPPKTVVERQPAPVINAAPLTALFAKYKDRRPPCEEMCKAMLAAGHTELRIAKYRQWCQNMEDTAEERQKVLDLIFAKFPSANKPTLKIKQKKVIKVVKKKMPGSTNNE